MIPLRDENPTGSVPIITLLLIGLNIYVFGYELSLPQQSVKGFFETWGFVPSKFVADPFGFAAVTLFTSMFLHGGVLHIAGNMLYLWVFGDNIEDHLGPVKFLVFYLTAGVAGSLLQCAMSPLSAIPQVGASGAIAGVLGAYLLLFPNARVLTLLFLIIIFRLVYLPAWLLLTFWIFLQFLQGSMSLGLQDTGGVAYFAHIGGFLAGVAMIVVLFRLTRIRRR